jgi:DNA adenine methylase
MPLKDHLMFNLILLIYYFYHAHVMEELCGFRKDGYMSTPCGVHDPIHPSRFVERVRVWHERVQGVEFLHDDFEVTMKLARKGDLVYCDPPYSDTQSIIYGSQQFSLMRLLSVIEDCKSRGVYVALSIDGTKHNGRKASTVTKSQRDYLNRR